MNNKSIIMVTALVIFIVVGFYGIYEYYNGYTVNPQNNTSNQTNNQTTDSAINSDAVNNASEQDITVDATVDNASDATVTIIPANNVSPESIPNYTEENLSYDAQPINTSANTSMQIQSQPQAETTRTAVTSTTSVFNLDNMVAKAPQCNSSDPMDSATNSSLTNPTYDQLITFLEYGLCRKCFALTNQALAKSFSRLDPQTVGLQSQAQDPFAIDDGQFATAVWRNAMDAIPRWSTLLTSLNLPSRLLSHAPRLTCF